MPEASNMQQFKIWLAVLFLSRKKFHAKQFVCADRLCVIVWYRSCKPQLKVTSIMNLSASTQTIVSSTECIVSVNYPKGFWPVLWETWVMILPQMLKYLAPATTEEVFWTVRGSHAENCVKRRRKPLEENKLENRAQYLGSKSNCYNIE